MDAKAQELKIRERKEEYDRNKIEQVCDINVINNNRYETVGAVVWDGQFMFKSLLVTGLEYETIDKVPDRVLEDIGTNPYTGFSYPEKEFSISAYSFDRIADLMAAAKGEMAKRRHNERISS